MNNIINRRRDLVVLITPEDVKVYSNIGVNVIDESLLPVIKIAQDLYIKKALGETLYNNLLAEWDLANRVPADLRDSTQTPDAIDYKALYNQLFLPLIWWSVTHYIFLNGVKITEKGVMFNQSDYAVNGEYEAIRAYEDRMRVTAQNYQEQLLCYIAETFKDDQVINLQVKSVGNYFGGIYLPHKVNSCKQCLTK